MSSIKLKLERLPPPLAPRPTFTALPDTSSPPRVISSSPVLSPLPAIVPSPARSRASLSSSPALPPRPTLDNLRDRIAQIVGRSPAPVLRADPTRGELPFILERTDLGPLYVRRLQSPAGARVGRAPLVGARDADPALLALLALDPRLAGCDPRRALYLDTETTGLAGGTGTVPFLLGLAWFDPDTNTFMLEQALLRRLGEEAPVLALLTERIAQASMLVTYNGKAFDLPLLRTRYVMNRIPAPIEPPHLDLVHLARRVHRARLKVRTLIAIENEVLGRARIGDIAGEDIVAVYAHFLRTGDEEALFGVVEHNAADVLAMVALVGLYGEPLGGLEPTDLAGVARTVLLGARRAASAGPDRRLAPLESTLELAAQLAEEAVARGGGHVARRARGDIAKTRGDKAAALADYEVIADEIDDPTVRLELAKLYEHHVRSFDQALAQVSRGTGEDPDAVDRRRLRLERKIARRLEVPPRRPR